jgi:hypothetical protein
MIWAGWPTVAGVRVRIQPDLFMWGVILLVGLSLGGASDNARLQIDLRAGQPLKVQPKAGCRAGRRRIGVTLSTDLTTFFGVLGLHAGVHSNDQQSHQYRADQHDHPYIEACVECLVAGSGSEQAGSGADGAECEIEFFHQTAGNE